MGAKNGQREAEGLAGRAGAGWGGKARVNHSVRSEDEVCAQCERGVCGVCTLHAVHALYACGVRVRQGMGGGEAIKGGEKVGDTR